jgi:hypothetical protein
MMGLMVAEEVKEFSHMTPSRNCADAVLISLTLRQIPNRATLPESIALMLRRVVAQVRSQFMTQEKMVAQLVETCC